MFTICGWKIIRAYLVVESQGVDNKHELIGVLEYMSLVDGPLGYIITK